MTTDFGDKNPKEVLEESDFPQYEQAMTDFHLRLSELHVDIFIMQEIIEFPFELFSIVENIFFQRTVNNFFQTSILQITRMATDSGSDTRTLMKFKNFMANAVKDVFKDDYRRLLRAVRFSSRTRDLLKKAKNLRDAQIAHSSRSDNSVINQKDSNITFEDLKSLRDELTKLFEVASFDVEYSYLFIAYDPTIRHSAGFDAPPDIERILDSLARQSPTLDMPEEDPEMWSHYRILYPERAIEQFNHYRRKFGLPDA